MILKKNLLCVLAIFLVQNSVNASTSNRKPSSDEIPVRMNCQFFYLDFSKKQEGMDSFILSEKPSSRFEEVFSHSEQYGGSLDVDLLKLNALFSAKSDELKTSGSGAFDYHGFPDLTAKFKGKRFKKNELMVSFMPTYNMIDRANHKYDHNDLRGFAFVVESTNDKKTTKIDIISLFSPFDDGIASAANFTIQTRAASKNGLQVSCYAYTASYKNK